MQIKFEMTLIHEGREIDCQVTAYVDPGHPGRGRSVADGGEPPTMPEAEVESILLDGEEIADVIGPLACEAVLDAAIEAYERQLEGQAEDAQQANAEDRAERDRYDA